MRSTCQAGSGTRCLRSAEASCAGSLPDSRSHPRARKKLLPEPGNPAVLIREISDAVVYEYSLVARPAYAGTTLDARQDAVHGEVKQGPGVATLWL